MRKIRGINRHKAQDDQERKETDETAEGGELTGAMDSEVCSMVQHSERTPEWAPCIILVRTTWCNTVTDCHKPDVVSAHFHWITFSQSQQRGKERLDN